MTADKKYVDAFHDYEEFMLKKRQYAKAVHVFHDQTGDYNEMIDDLPVKELEVRQKEYLQHERDFHEVMDSFDRAFHAYKETLINLKPLKTPVQIVVRKKKYELSLLKGEMQVIKI